MSALEDIRLLFIYTSKLENLALWDYFRQYLLWKTHNKKCYCGIETLFFGFKRPIDALLNPSFLALSKLLGLKTLEVQARFDTDLLYGSKL